MPAATFQAVGVALDVDIKRGRRSAGESAVGLYLMSAPATYLRVVNMMPYRSPSASRISRPGLYSRFATGRCRQGRLGRRALGPYRLFETLALWSAEF